MINEKALYRVKNAKMRGEGFVELLEKLALTLEFTNAAEASITVDYQHKDIETKPGDLIPYITIGLRQPNDLPG